jgi:hypothetical protein
MIKDLLVSFRDNFKEKSRNPFLGTYLIVWLVRNWELVYTIFNFDSDKKLKDKINFINTYYSNKDFLNNLWTNIFWAFGLLIFTYILLNISRLIVNLSEKQLTPWIYKITDSKSIVLKSVYERTRSERDDLQVRLDQERESKSRLESRIKNLETEITDINSSKPKDKEQKINPEELKPIKIIPDDSSILFQKLKDKKLLQDFIDTSVMINKDEFISNDYKPKDYFIELGLITFAGNNSSGNYKKYALTPDGQNVLKKHRLE